MLYFPSPMNEHIRAEVDNHVTDCPSIYELLRLLYVKCRDSETTQMFTEI
jgi:hypothetical protein